MVTIDFDKEEGLTLLRWINYLFASIQDVESIKDDQKALDAAELDFRRAVDDVRIITPEQTIKLFNKLAELERGLIEEGSVNIGDVNIPEVNKEDVTIPA